MKKKGIGALIISLLIFGNIPVSAGASASYLEYSEKSAAFGENIVLSNKITECAAGTELRFDIEPAAEGLLELSLTYTAAGQQNIILSLDIDGNSPFEEAERLEFPAFWENAEGPWRDGSGNEFAPEQVLYDKAVTVQARDYTGRYEAPYLFALSAGAHTVTITFLQGEMTLSEIRFSPPETPKPYKAPKNSKTQAAPIIIEGEAAAVKNDRALIPLSNESSPAVSPADPFKSKLNYIGGANWKTPGSSLTWEFKVKTAGYYSLSFNYRQKELLGGVSYRSLKIDGKNPFEEARRIKFKYGSKWQYTAFSGDDGPFLIYFTKGSHTLTLTATAGPLSEIYSAMLELTAQMGDLYVDITKIVGETVDIYRSYELFNQIPEFNERLKASGEMLDEIAERLEALQEKSSGSSVSVIRNAALVINQMRNNPYSAHRYKSSFYDAYTNLSALMGEMTSTPLDLDRIILNPAGADAPKIKASFFQRLGFSVKRFAATFFSDYNGISGGGSQSDALTIWVNWGRDQAQALNSVIQNSFVRDTGIPVNISVVNATLIQAILAGSGPDCTLQMQRTEPVNLAMRGALKPLSEFDDIDEILTRFEAGADVPYRYGGSLYALPDTRSFYMMFARTDIFEALELTIPETWDEFISTAVFLQRNNLGTYLPYTQVTDSGTVNTGVGGLTLFPTLLIQKELSLYNNAQTASTLSEPRQLQEFAKWVSWYTKYKLPVTMDFYNRFRIGSAPVGIAAYTLYTQLKAAAPEIDGRWTMLQLPGTKSGDGTVNSASAGFGTGCAITKLSKNPENAWKFLKWWTSAEVQLKYSNSLESVIGPLGRVATSNREALEAMSWDGGMLAEMTSQMENVVDLPEIPGGYYTARGVDQAFWSVIEQGDKPAETLTKWAAAVDREIARKRAEYSK